MTFQVYPNPPTGPTWVAPAAASGAEEIRELDGSLMLIQVEVVGPEFVTPQVSRPAVVLVTNGVEVEITSENGVSPTKLPQVSASASATIQTGTGGDPAAFRVEISKPVHTSVSWRIRFRNQDPQQTIGLTWVVCNTFGEIAQPWIVLPSEEQSWPSLSAATTGSALQRRVTVGNHGTGDLVITQNTGPLPGSSVFTLVDVPDGPIAPNAAAELVFAVLAPPTVGDHRLPVPVASNDPSVSGLASPTAEHNRTVALRAVVVQPPVLALTDPLSPPLGAPRTQVTIRGIELDVANLAVAFNGVEATVLTATETSASVLVPAGLPVGAVTVTLRTDGGPAPASTTFVALGAPPTITAVPGSGARGTAVMIDGTNFDTAGGDETVVAFDDELATMSDLGETKLTVTIPTTVAPGPREITVATRWGFATHTAKLTVT